MTEEKKFKKLIKKVGNFKIYFAPYNKSLQFIISFGGFPPIDKNKMTLQEMAKKLISKDGIIYLSMEAKELFYQYLEKELEELYENLKPELKDKFCFLSTRNGDRKWGAITNRLTNPPTITIHINSLEETYRPDIIKSMKWLISHEIIHTFQTKQTENQEDEAYKKQAIMKFFKD